MVIDTSKELMKAVVSGYSKKDIAYNTTDYNMLANLERNVYHFSAAKNYQELKTFTLAIKDDNGKIRSFSDYKQAIDQIHLKYNSWLETEYDAAIGGSQMASKWVDFPEGSILEYRTAGDSRVRDDHAKLNGTKRKKEDPFWNTYYPPNGWKCRCTAIELSNDTEETPLKDIQRPKIQDLWRTNTAKKGLVFPEDHPYYKGIPKEVLEKEKAIHAAVVRENVRSWSKENIPAFGLKQKVTTAVFNELTVKRADIKTITGKPHEFSAEVYKNATRLDDLLNQSVYITSGIDNGKHPDVKLWHYFKTKIADSNSYINVMETFKGEFRVYYISDHFNIKKVKDAHKIKKS